MNLSESLPAAVLERLAVDRNERALIDAGIISRNRSKLAESRRNLADLEVRENDDGTVHVTGYATTWDTEYDVAGGPPWGWVESISRGAVTKSLAERDDVRFLINHDGLALARSTSATMTLEADDIGLLVDVPSLDVRRNHDAAALASAVDRRDVDQMSVAFYATRQKWNDDYTERRITEVRLVDVSAVTYPANTATIIGLRSAQDEQIEERGMGLALAQAIATSLA